MGETWNSWEKFDDSNFTTTALSTQHAHMEVYSVVGRVKVNYVQHCCSIISTWGPWRFQQELTNQPNMSLGPWFHNWTAGLKSQPRDSWLSMVMGNRELGVILCSCIDAMLKAHGTLEYAQVFWVVNHTGRLGAASLVVTVRLMQIEHCIGTAFALDVQYTARSRDDFWPIAAATRTGCGCPSGTKRFIQVAKTSSVFDGLIHCQHAADRSLMHFVLLDSYAAPGCNWLEEFEKTVGNDYHG